MVILIHGFANWSKRLETIIEKQGDDFELPFLNLQKTLKFQTRGK
jgi:hypothetical protein